MKKRTLSISLALHIIIASLVLAILVSIFSMYFDYQSYRKNVYQTVEELLTSTEDTASEAIFTLNESIAQTLVDGIVANKFIIASTLYDESGMKLATASENSSTEVWRPLDLENETISKIIVLADQSSTGTLEIVIDVEQSLAPFYFDSIKSVIIEFIQVIAISLIVYRVSANLVAKPVEILSRTLENIPPGEKSPEISLTQDRSEIGNLARNTVNYINESYRFAKELEEKQKERLILEEKLQQSYKMEAIGQLAGGIAHDFNNMLTAIMGAAQMLQFTDCKNDEKSMKYISMIMDTSDKAADLTSKLLSFSRKGTVATTVIDIHQLIDDTISIFSQTMDKKISIHSNQSANAHMLKGDSSSLQSALMNLGINASHAMPDGGELYIETKNVTLSKSFCDTSMFTLEPGEFIEIKMRDTGSGIEKSIINKIYDPFYTTKDKSKGTGLGLSVTYGCIQEHKGSIEVMSEIGVGTEFTLYLPCSDDVTFETATKFQHFEGAGELILLVDDDEVIRLTLKELLEEVGYSVIIAEDGNAGLEMYRKHQKDIRLVLLDMIMPGKDGYDTFFEIQKLNKQCKILIISGFYNEERIAVLLDSGAEGVIQKPYKKNELFEMIAASLSS